MAMQIIVSIYQMWFYPKRKTVINAQTKAKLGSIKDVRNYTVSTILYDNTRVAPEPVRVLTRVKR
jgi:hypothetical protein